MTIPRNRTGKKQTTAYRKSKTKKSKPSASSHSRLRNWSAKVKAFPKSAKSFFFNPCFPFSETNPEPREIPKQKTSSPPISSPLSLRQTFQRTLPAGHGINPLLRRWEGKVSYVFQSSKFIWDQWPKRPPLPAPKTLHDGEHSIRQTQSPRVVFPEKRSTFILRPLGGEPVMNRIKANRSPNRV